ncbi:MAG: hypothetical protein WCE62_15985 [Polyangiales bacterium]
MRAVGVFALLFALTSPASAGPANSTIGGKRLTNDNVHNVGVGYPSLFYEWWNKGPRRLDWALKGALVYGDWPVAYSDGRFIRIGLGLSAPLRWHLSTKRRTKATNDVSFRLTPGILLAGNRDDAFTFGLKAEVAAPVSLDVHERVSVITGGAIPFTVYINNRDIGARGFIPLLFRMGVEIKAANQVSPFFLFELGPGIGVGSGVADVSFAWRLWVGTSFWSVMGK